MPTVRALTDFERSLLPLPLAAGVDFSAVRIVSRAHNPYAALMRISVVRGSRIFWPGAPAEAVSLAARAHLAHELVHVWQYQALNRSGIELLFSRVYRYRLDPARAFLSYGYEQQAAIVEDYVRLCDGGQCRWTEGAGARADYERVIATAAGVRL
ncbi:MAG TPA: hypothetical protein DDZ68_11615 [Parvularcula sp.]|nr:hypothetical protein [Parvularcula sp.]